MRYVALLVYLLCAVEVMAVDVIAHRGYGCDVYDNTLEAIEQAWGASVDAVEIDVRVSTDGVVYLFHDDEYQGQKVDGLTHDALQALTPFHVPSLAELFAKTKGNGYFLLDLKSADTLQLQALAEVVRQSSMPMSRLVIQSRDALALRDARRRLPGARFFYLSSLRYRLPFFLAPSAGSVIKEAEFAMADGVSLKGRRFLNAQYLDLFKRAGLSVYMWTINTPESQRFYQQTPVDGLITDNAVQLAKVLRGESPAMESCAPNR